MDIENLHTSLEKQSDYLVSRHEIIQYIQTVMKDLPEDQTSKINLAYDVASLLSTEYATTLNENDVLEQVLMMAGELEVDQDFTYEKWVAFKVLVSKL